MVSGEADAKQKEEELLSCETSSKSTPASKGSLLPMFMDIEEVNTRVAISLRV